MIRVTDPTHGDAVHEFPSFDMAYCPMIPGPWREMSWHNDAMPMWSAGPTTGVAVDWLRPEDSEFPQLRATGELRRYQVFVMYDDPEHGPQHTEDELLLVTDDWQEVLRMTKQRGEWND